MDINGKPFCSTGQDYSHWPLNQVITIVALDYISFSMLGADGAGDEELYSEAHTFLSEQGNINFGVLKGEPQSGEFVTNAPHNLQVSPIPTALGLQIGYNVALLDFMSIKCGTDLGYGSVFKRV